MSDGDSYFYDKAEPRDKSDAEKRRNNRESERIRAALRPAVPLHEVRKFNESFKRLLDPNNDD